MSRERAKGTGRCRCGCGANVYGHLAEYAQGHRPIRPLAERLAGKTVKQPDGCWHWRGYISSTGYGEIGLGRKSEGKVSAHRAAWMVANGPIPDGMFVLHRCDVRRCVNPDHLFLGTNADNAADMKRKGRGRGAEGVANSNARLTKQQVDEIRDRYVPGVRAARRTGRSSTELAFEYGVTPQHIRAIGRYVWRKSA